MSRKPAVLAALLLLGGCAAAARETPAERVARLQDDCAAAGFQKDSEAFRLCLLIQAQNERLAALERRVAFIQQDVSFPPLGYYRWWP